MSYMIHARLGIEPRHADPTNPVKKIAYRVSLLASDIASPLLGIL